MNENKKQGLQQKYMELQMLQHQMQQVQQQIQLLENQAMEMNVVEQAIEDFGKSKKNSELLVTLTPGLFVKAKLEDPTCVLVNVGGGAVVKKSIEDGKALISKQARELTNMHQELIVQLHELHGRSEGLQADLKKLVESKS